MNVGVVCCVCIHILLTAAVAVEPPHLSALPASDLGKVNYPKNYISPPFRRAPEGENPVPALLADLERVGAVQPKELKRLKSVLHADDDIEPTVRKILAKAKISEQKASRNGTHDLEEESTAPSTPLTPEETLAKMRQQLPNKLKALQRRLAIALQIFHSQRKASLSELQKKSDEALELSKLAEQTDKTSKKNEAIGKLRDEFSQALLREQKLWDRVLIRIEEHFEDLIHVEKLQVKRLADDKTKGEKVDGPGKGDQAEEPAEEKKKTVQGFYESCQVDGSSISKQLETLFPVGSVSPISAHPSCWCEGRLQQVYEQRTGIVDYHYNNFQTLRICLENNCWLCQSVFEFVWKHLGKNMEVDTICGEYSSQKRFPLSSEDTGRDDCARMTRGFLMNFQGVMTRISELFGGVEALTNAKDCDKEYAAMQAKITTVSREVCYTMDCCKLGKLMSAEDVASFRSSITVS